MDFPHGVLAVDTETTGLDWVRGHIGAVSLAWGVGPSNNLATRNVGLALQLVEEARDAGVKLVFHNAAFDAHFMLRHGVSIDWDNYEDTLIMARLRDNLGDAGLKDLGERYLGVPPNQRDALDDWLKANKFKKGDILQAPDELLLPYAAQDARLTLQLYLHFRDTRSYPGYETILAKEYRVRAIIFEAEEAGVPLDVAATAELATVLEDERSSIEDKLRELGGERNFSSPTQVASLLFDELGYAEKLRVREPGDAGPKVYRVHARTELSRILALALRECEQWGWDFFEVISEGVEYELDVRKAIEAGTRDIVPTYERR